MHETGNLKKNHVPLCPPALLMASASFYRPEEITLELQYAERLLWNRCQMMPKIVLPTAGLTNLEVLSSRGSLCQSLALRSSLFKFYAYKKRENFIVIHLYTVQYSRGTKLCFTRPLV